jgi:hypothetical protein
LAEEEKLPCQERSAYMESLFTPHPIRYVHPTMTGSVVWTPIKGPENAKLVNPSWTHVFNSTQVFKSNQWQLRSSLRQPMGGEAFCT